MSFPGSILLTGQDVLTTSTSKIHPIGTRGYTRDGRVFRYARNGGTALKSAYIVQSSVPLAGAIGLNTGTTELKANTTKVTVINGATGVFTTVNSFADGYLVNYSSSTSRGGGVYAQIKSHTTQSATATGKIVIQFYSGDSMYNPSTNVGTTNARLGVVRNPYDKVVVKPAGIVTAPVVGVPVRNVAANAYFWAQTWGPCSVRSDTVASKVGTPVGASTGTSVGRVISIISTKASSAASIASWTQVNYLISQVGTAMLVGVSGETRMVYLKLAP